MTPPAPRAWWAGTLLLAVACAVLQATAPTAGDFWWFEGPTHAMNGVFVHDFVAAMPFRDPVGFAIDYYLKYPAVTILFYPPLFPAIEAVFFALFGVSHFTAQLAVTACLFAFALGLRRTARFWLPDGAAVAVGLVGLGLPLITFWGRQVMLEMPAYAFIVWAGVFLLRYMTEARGWQIFAAVLLFVAALYVKQTVAFYALVFGLVLLLHQGFGVLKRRALWLAGVAGAVLLVPLVLITRRFGATNVDLATVSTVPNDSPLTYYASILPVQLGYAVLALAVLFAVLHIARPKLPWRDPVLLLSLCTLAVGYVFFTSIVLKDERYTIHILAPFALFAVAALYRLLPETFATPTCLIFAACVFAYGAFAVPVPFIDGHRAAAQAVAAAAPPGSTVMFHGQRSASFVFNLRALGTRPDMRVLRAEKLLVRYRQGRALGVQPIDVSRADIEGYFQRFRISHAVFETGFWTDIAPIALLEEVLAAPPFVALPSIAVAANVAHNDRELRLYRNTGTMAEVAEPFAFDMPLIGGRFSGSGAR